MHKPNPMKGKGHHNKVLSTTSAKGDGKKKDDDSSFVYNFGILIGCVAEIETRGGEKFEGILSAFTNQALKIMIEAAHEPNGDDESSITKHYDLLIVPAEKVSVIKFRNAELTYATRDFQTDAGIGATRQLNVGDKELTPWDGADDAGEHIELDSSTTNGWEAQEMFKKNEEKYGVISSFKQDLSGYTTQLDKTDADSFKKHEEQAAQIAQEIEKNSSSWERTNSKLENGEDEEEAFSAVVRPVRNNNNHSNNNATQNNSSVGSEKYVPPSRRQQTVQQGNIPQVGQGHPMNNNGPPQQISNNNSNNRKPMYSGQNPRNNFGAGSNSSYHHDRRGGYNDQRRGPPQGQYAHPNNHGDGRRMDEGNRQPRMTNKGPMDRDRRGGGGGGGRDAEQVNKLKQFGDNFRLQNHGDSAPSRMRMPPNQQPQQQQQQQHSAPPLNVHMSGSPSGTNIVSVSNPPGVRNPSPPNNNNNNNNNNNSSALQISSTQSPPVKNKKEEFPPPPLIQSSDRASTNSENSSGSGTNSPHNSSSNQTNASSASPSPSMSSSVTVVNQTTNETTPSTTPTAAAATTPGSAESQSSVAVSGSGDSKGSSSEADNKSKKTPFAFNPNAKEFSPIAKAFTPQRSPSTPPRPPSTSTPQLMTAPMHSFMPIPMPHQTAALLYAPPPPTYPTHAQAALTPSSNSSASSGGNTPRHSHRKGMIGVPSRSEISQPMQMATGPPILAPASIQAAAPPAQFAYVQAQGGTYPQMMRVVPHMPVYQHEGSGGTQLHQSMHFIHHNGTPQSNAGHQSNNTPQSNPNAPTSNVQANGHAYGQGGGNHGHPHVGYPFVSLPMVGVTYPHAPPGHAVVMPYAQVSHQGGANSGIQHSQ